MATENEHTEQNPEGGDNGGGEDTIAEIRAAQKRAEKRARDAEAAAAETDSLRRELAFAKANVDTESPVGKLFVKGYDGEITQEAIEAAWGELNPSGSAGGTTPPPPTAESGTGTPEAPQDELARLRAERAGLADTSPPGSEPTVPPGRAMMDAAYDAQGGARVRPNGGMGDKAMNAGFSALFAAAGAEDGVASGAAFKQPGETWADATERWRASQQ
jgi:hypothetical protein